NPASFEPPEEARLETRERPLRVGTLALLGPRAHLPALVRAFAQAARTRPELSLVLLGAVAHERAVSEARALAGELHVADRLSVPGELPEEACSRALLE